MALMPADGRMTIYGPLRYNSLTSKGIGQTVAQGEYLGTAGSYTVRTRTEQADATVTVLVVNEILRLFLPLIQH